jgi:hypothetical protein
MKTQLLIIALIVISFKALSQENAVTFSGGYAFSTIEDTDTKATGWRINSAFEFNPMGGNFMHGLNVGYISISGTDDDVISNTYTISSIPIYYAPKFTFGKEKFKGFIKGVVGTQFAFLKREGPLGSLSDNDFGFYGGGGAGIMIFLKENIFINAEYEIAWASNAYYKDGWMNSAMGGIGFKF